MLIFESGALQNHGEDKDGVPQPVPAQSASQSQPEDGVPQPQSSQSARVIQPEDGVPQPVLAQSASQEEQASMKEKAALRIQSWHRGQLARKEIVFFKRYEHVYWDRVQ